MNFNTFTGPAVAAALLIAATGCSTSSKVDYEVIGKQGATRFAVIEPNASREMLFEASDRICPSGEMCKVHFWENPLDAATSYPMSGDQVAMQSGDFVFNPNTNYTRLLTRCDHPEASSDTCFTP